MRRATLGLAAVLLLAGCGGSTGRTTPSPTPTPTAPATSATGTSGSPGTSGTATGGTALTVVVDPDGTGQAVVVTSLTCDPPGGDVADPDAACTQVAAVGIAGFAVTDPDAVCTQQYDGPQTASVTGTVEGVPVDADFTRTDGCAISRWDALSALLPTGR